MTPFSLPKCKYFGTPYRSQFCVFYFKKDIRFNGNDFAPTIIEESILCRRPWLVERR